MLAGLEKVRFAGEISGKLKATWLDEGKQLTGEGHARSRRPARSRCTRCPGRILPIHGELNFVLSQWSSHFDRSFIRFGESTLQFVGTVSAREASSLRVEANSEDLSDFAFLVPELKGKGNLLGVVEGTQSQPTARGSFLVENLSYQNFAIDSLEGQFRPIDRRSIC